jgi:hypothetical protein
MTDAHPDPCGTHQRNLWLLRQTREWNERLTSQRLDAHHLCVPQKLPQLQHTPRKKSKV